jgi:hypothetical protein
VVVVVVVGGIAVVVVEDVLGVQGFEPVEEGEDEGEDRVVASVVCALEEFAVLVEAAATVLSAFVEFAVLVPLLVCREERSFGGGGGAGGCGGCHSGGDGGCDRRIKRYVGGVRGR